jgi:hypothetical protein
MLTLRVAELAPISAQSPHPASSKQEAKQSAAAEALLKLKEEVAKIEPLGGLKKGLSLEANSSSGPEKSIKDIYETFQATFRTTPVWLVEQCEDDCQVFRASMSLPAGPFSSGPTVQGVWARGKQKAKLSALERALNFASADGAESGAGLGEAGVSLCGANMKDLQEKFMRDFHTNPKWGDIERHPTEVQDYRVTIILSDQRVVQGDWARGKQEAKLAALRQASTMAGTAPLEGGTLPPQSSQVTATVSRKPTAVHAPPGAAAGDRSLSALNEEFQQNFRDTPSWTMEVGEEVAETPEDALPTTEASLESGGGTRPGPVPRFRAALVLPGTTTRVQGSWAASKQEAKRLALESALSADVPFQPSAKHSKAPRPPGPVPQTAGVGALP